MSARKIRLRGIVIFTPDKMARARERLGLTLEEMAAMLGYLGTQRRQMQYDLETGRREIREPQRRLTEAYLAGYRPKDWPRDKD
jgi:transcriptional regulator with XRE-family HTH domain